MGVRLAADARRSHRFSRRAQAEAQGGQRDVEAVVPVDCGALFPAACFIVMRSCEEESGDVGELKFLTCSVRITGERS